MNLLGTLIGYDYMLNFSPWKPQAYTLTHLDFLEAVYLRSE